MFRAPDPWDVGPKKRPPLKCGYADGFSARYTKTARTLGKGGFGEVCVCTSNATGAEYACKSIAKQLDVPNISEARELQHIGNIKREVSVLRKLRGTLNVVYLEDVFEDETHVYIVMELCKGGELLQKLNSRHYSERTVASYMRAVLRTIAQCHHHRVLHRDIKPGNFMLLTDAEDAPVKAIDFGLAVFFDPKSLPLTDLGLEGTPHYMAPETLSSETWPASDVWAAGIMTYQLLSGRFPFDDWKNPKNPALSQLWKSILTEEPKFTGAAWEDVSDNAKDFIKTLLTKDPKQRPSAQEALSHPWLEGKSKQRVEGKPLAATIVQRLQRFSTNNAFKRTVLDMIANELLMQHLHQQALQQQQQQQQAMQQYLAATGTKMVKTGSSGSVGNADSTHGTSALPSPLAKGGLDVSRPQVRSAAACSFIRTLQDKAATVHAGNLLGKVLSKGSLGSGSRGSFHPSSGSNQNSYGSFHAAGALASAAAHPEPPGAPGPRHPVAPSQPIPARSHASGIAHPMASSLPITMRGSSLHAADDLPSSGSPVHLGREQSEELQLLANMPMPPHYVSPPADYSMVVPPPHPRPTATMPIPMGGSKAGAGYASADALHGMPGLAAEAQGAPMPAQYGYPVPQQQSTPQAVPGKLKREGSGHALQHYAFLLAAGERSLHGLSQRTMQRSMSTAALNTLHPPGPYQGSYTPGGLLSTSLHQPSLLAQATNSGRPSMEGQTLMPESSQGTLQRSPSLLTVHGTHDVKRLLHTVQKQRKEHRKLQRLMLDPSGRSMSLYASVQQQQQQQQQQPDQGIMEVDGDATAASDGASVPDGLSSIAPTRESTQRMSEGGSEVDSESKGIKKDSSLLQKVSQALLKPVKTLFKPGAEADAHTNGQGAGAPMDAIEPTSPTAGRSPRAAKPTSALTQAIAGLPDTPLARTSIAAAAAAVDSAFARRSERAGTDSEGPIEPGDESKPLEGGGRGQGAYAALLGTKVSKGTPGAGASGPNSGVSTPLGHASVQPNLARTSQPEDLPVAAGSSPAQKQFTGNMPSIHTVKAHKKTSFDITSTAGKDPVSKPSTPPAAMEEHHSIASQLARIENQRQETRDEEAAAAAQQMKVGGTVSKGAVFNILGHLLGGQSQLAEFQNVLSKLQYDQNSELSFEQISEGLRHLGYHLEPSEVETLLGEVAMGGDHISQGAFLASQVDWRHFQANHREEWLACLRKAFDGLACKTDGKIREDQIVALLKSKLPEEEVNLAVQETLLDAAVLGAEGLDFDDFARLLAADSESDFSMRDAYGHPHDKASPGGQSLLSDHLSNNDLRDFSLVRSTSLDLYDPRLDQNPSLRGVKPEAAGPATGPVGATSHVQTPLPPSWLAGALEMGTAHAGNHYTPGLETVVDEEDV